MKIKFNKSKILRTLMLLIPFIMMGVVIMVMASSVSYNQLNLSSVKLTVQSLKSLIYNAYFSVAIPRYSKSKGPLWIRTVVGCEQRREEKISFSVPLSFCSLKFFCLKSEFHTLPKIYF